MKEPGKRRVSARRCGHSSPQAKPRGRLRARYQPVCRGEAPLGRSPAVLSCPGPYDSSVSRLHLYSSPVCFHPGSCRPVKTPRRPLPAPACTAKVTGYHQYHRHLYCHGNSSLRRVPQPQGVLTPSFPCVPGPQFQLRRGHHLGEPWQPEHRRLRLC